MHHRQAQYSPIGEYSYDAFGKRRNPYTWGYDVNDDQEHLADGITWTTTTRGFTDHEQLRAVGLVHMNGRVFDPHIGRMISADPLVPHPLRAQSFNDTLPIFSRVKRRL